jgi:hypothetical protein
MKKLIRVAISFSRFDDNHLANFAMLVVICLKNNPLFPNLPVSIALLTALQTAYQNALTAAAHGGKPATAAKNEARAALISALRQNAAYVQSLGLKNASDVFASGFDIVNVTNRQSPLTQPVFTLQNFAMTQLKVNLRAVRNAKVYQVQFSTVLDEWQEAGIYTTTQGIFLTNLTPGTVYHVRLRAIGGSTQYSPWSAIVSRMAT